MSGEYRVPTTEQPEPDLMTANELRELLRIGRTRFFELASKDALPIPTLRVGRQLRFSRRAYEQWAAQSPNSSDAA